MEGVQPIRNAVFSHFKGHFASHNTPRSGVDNLPFKSLSHAEGGGLTKSFSALKLKQQFGIVTASRVPDLME